MGSRPLEVGLGAVTQSKLTAVCSALVGHLPQSAKGVRSRQSAPSRSVIANSNDLCVSIGSMNHDDIPKYHEFIVPVVRAVVALGRSATGQEIVDRVLGDLNPAEEVLAITYDNRPDDSVYLERIHWARSYAKLIGYLESPKRGVFLITDLGKELAALPDDEARRKAYDMNRDLRKQRTLERRTQADKTQLDDEAQTAADEDEAVIREVETGEQTQTWQDVLLARLHKLTPQGFEEFALYLLRLYGLQLERVGGTGDEGIDGIGTAPLSPVLSSRVAVQVKRFDPSGRPIGREVVALFQRDAQTKGAERAILVTLGRFSPAARKAAIVTSPTVDLIDGERLAELVKEHNVGLRTVIQVREEWFDKFD